MKKKNMTTRGLICNLYMDLSSRLGCSVFSWAIPLTLVSPHPKIWESTFWKYISRIPQTFIIYCALYRFFPRILVLTVAGLSSRTVAFLEWNLSIMLLMSILKGAWIRRIFCLLWNTMDWSPNFHQLRNEDILYQPNLHQLLQSCVTRCPLTVILVRFTSTSTKGLSLTGSFLSFCQGALLGVPRVISLKSLNFMTVELSFSLENNPSIVWSSFAENDQSRSYWRR